MPHPANCETCAQVRQITESVFKAFAIDPDDSVVGKTAMVTTPIKPGGIGEVRLAVRGGSETFLAVAAHDDEEFKPYDPAEVVGLRAARTLVVRKAG